MPTLQAYDYAIVRVVPCIEREEFLNAGVVLWCREKRYLGARTGLDVTRLRALAGKVDEDAIRQQLTLIVAICKGRGPVGQIDLVERFRWLAYPRSTVVQVSPVHPGLCEDPETELERLYDALVRVN